MKSEAAQTQCWLNVVRAAAEYRRAKEAAAKMSDRSKAAQMLGAADRKLASASANLISLAVGPGLEPRVVFYPAE